MKIAIIFPSGHITSTPCLKSIALLLAKREINVDIYTVINISSSNEEGIRTLERCSNNINTYIYPLRMKYYWENIALTTKGFLIWWLKKCINKDYDIIIAAGIRSLFIIGIISYIKSMKYAYLSLELYPEEDIKGLKGKIIKYFERLFNKRAKFSIIQDDKRAALLKKINLLNGHEIKILPNSDLPQSIERQRKNFKKILGLEGKKVALYAGSIFAKWAMVPELIQATSEWPEDWILLLHTRARVAELKKYIPELAGELRSKVYLSSEPLDEEDYEDLVKSVDVGIALYDGRISQNILYVGLSSGKIAQYLNCGIPVIINELPLLAELVEAYNCGFTVKNVREIRYKLDEVFKRKEMYSEGARKAYEEVFNPELYIDKIIYEIKNVTKGRINGTC